ncbi:hypothetical protein PR048_030707 [Dryococelus australis]|uniref:HAT C-terminal dimerisation domain-containing protein n=1 Tax=Dryococelus australis TaxID=614101 RepID=A0ABQ9G9P1_9NEOP|nr:hypothetical protein PR048_030707 [Dryococelus australis]
MPAKHFLGAYGVWSAKWDRRINEEDSNQKIVIELLSECGRDVFSIINMLLKVLATLPVSVATAERTFSTLKRIKTWFRTTMDDRLIGLGLSWQLITILQ